MQEFMIVGTPIPRKVSLTCLKVLAKDEDANRESCNECLKLGELEVDRKVRDSGVSNFDEQYISPQQLGATVQKAQETFEPDTEIFEPETEIFEPESDKPPFKFAQLIRQALMTNKDSGLPLPDIYSFISKKYPYYKMENQNWQNSIRPLLSMHFEKVPNPNQGKGKGARAIGATGNRGNCWRLKKGASKDIEKNTKNYKYACEKCGFRTKEAGMNCIKIGLPGKSILRDYFQENMTSPRPFFLLRISFPG